ncbi:hypothetical protein [uncultured Winogradskyella sp.]|uniref:hypothetical protein n=1 Tax=uncultured Winogradskyella sp. TaxID=395353 RepID=UPI002608B7FC|nr:hypothetical protein [uncultured Winogradskyella sp.]
MNEHQANQMLDLLDHIANSLNRIEDRLEGNIDLSKIETTLSYMETSLSTIESDVGSIEQSV